MHSNPLRLATACLFLAAVTVRAEDSPLRDLLRDALYTEEVTRDSEKAAKQYEDLLARHDAQKTFAASALFRLAEVRRKQDRKDDAIQLYQRLLAEFPGAAAETKLARENLAALGGKPPESKGPPTDFEIEEIARLEGLAKSAPDIILDPRTLEEAARNGRSKLVAYLLKTGSRPYAGGALTIAAESGSLEIVKQLTAGKEPVPAAVATAAIQAAIQSNRYTILEFLLQSGCKAGEMSGSDGIHTGPSALSYALLNGSSQCAEILLKHGTDIDATSAYSDVSSRSGATALQSVISKENYDAANWLLDKGAKPDIPSRGYGITPLHEVLVPAGTLAIMQRLLEAGADPNRRTGNSEITDPSRNFLRNVTPLAIAVQTFKPIEKVRLLLKHGADAKTDKQLIPLVVQRSYEEVKMECLKLLVDAGARPDDAWMKSFMEQGNGEVRDFLVEKVYLPDFANDSKIQLVINDPCGIRSANIAARSGETAPPDLGTWLLANHQYSKWAGSTTGSLEYQWLLWHKGDDGVMAKQELDFSGSAMLPVLRWGDVVECRITMPGSGGRSLDKGLRPEVLAVLRKRIAFPITFEIDGKSREITMRGDRFFFDPTKNEVPLTTLQPLVEYFLQDPVGSLSPTIHVTRKGWSDVRLSYGSKEASKFILKTDDRVKVEIPEQAGEDRVKARREFITLKADGYPFMKSIRARDGIELQAASIPTLIQAIVETQVPSASSWLDLMENKTFDVAKMSEENAFSGFILLPHPDLAKLRIRRLLEDGTEKVIDVNLAKIIASATDQTTAEEAKKADVLLQFGDIVEISLLKDHVDKPWKGFSAQEEGFFAKALSGRVQVTDGEENITKRDLLYKSPRFIETESGWIPLPPESGMPSVRGSWLIQNNRITVKRGGSLSDSLEAARFFLRDGDEINIQSGNLR